MKLDKGLDYNEFLKGATLEEINMIKNQEKISKLCDNKLDDIKNLNKKANILVFSETRCGDAATAIPILLALRELNKNINIQFFNTEKNTYILEKNFGESRIPTIVKIDESGNILGEYIEFPKCIKDRLKNEGREAVVKDFRSGRYSNKIQDELIDLILK